MASNICESLHLWAFDLHDINMNDTDLLRPEVTMETMGFAEGEEQRYGETGVGGEAAALSGGAEGGGCWPRPQGVAVAPAPPPAGPSAERIRRWRGGVREPRRAGARHTPPLLMEGKAVRDDLFRKYAQSLELRAEEAAGDGSGGEQAGQGAELEAELLSEARALLDACQGDPGQRFRMVRFYEELQFQARDHQGGPAHLRQLCFELFLARVECQLLAAVAASAGGGGASEVEAVEARRVGVGVRNGALVGEVSRLSLRERDRGGALKRPATVAVTRPSRSVDVTDGEGSWQPPPSRPILRASLSLRKEPLYSDAQEEDPAPSPPPSPPPPLS
ncbi:hypothetical protein JZ751_006336 [Albula glossodonta]|uniref:Spermatogenesis-associated protein 2 PUB-like domain-containing protein n=1 Tax=Albula glossodonta TaxID=121402 RepID=A0A8T2MM38_9TELE|nr:hypothetical protein JZ751_006336 [Albula glossodonta]